MSQPTGKHAIITSVYHNGRLIQGVQVIGIVEIEPDCWRGEATINGNRVMVNKNPTFMGWVADK